MKKIAALILALVMVLALAACGSKSESGNENENENKEPSILGDWEDEEGNYLTFSEGGIGSFTSVYSDWYNTSFTYENKEGVVTIHYQKKVYFSTQDAHASFQMSEDGSKLVSTLGDEETFTQKGMEYTKCNGEHTNKGPEPVATITTKSGTVEKLTSKQVCDLYDDQALFNREYYGAEAVLVGKVAKIQGSTTMNGHYMRGFIEIEDKTHMNWVVEVENLSDLGDLKVGDQVRATGRLYEAFVEPTIYIINGWTTTVTKIG